MEGGDGDLDFVVICRLSRPPLDAPSGSRANL